MGVMTWSNNRCVAGSSGICEHASNLYRRMAAGIRFTATARLVQVTIEQEQREWRVSEFRPRSKPNCRDLVILRSAPIRRYLRRPRLRFRSKHSWR